MMRHKIGMLNKLLAMLLTIVTPISQAQTSIPRGENIPTISGGEVWEAVARKAYEDEGITQIPANELQELSRFFFADYLGYLNAIGLELASFENSLTGRKEIREQGECSAETVNAFNELLTNSVQSDLYTFTDTYCRNACRQKAEMEFGLIANFAQPDGLPKTCADRAREMFDSYHCNMSGDAAPVIRDSDLTSNPIVIPALPTRSSIAAGEPDSKLIPKDLKGTTSRIDPDLPVRGGAVGTGGIKLIPVPKLPLISKTTAEVDRGFKNVLSKQKKVCSQKRSDILRQTFSVPGYATGSAISTTVRNPNDPRWTTTDETQPASDNKISETSAPKNPACKSSGPEMFDRFASLRTAYNRIANEKISESLGHWPIYDEEGTINKDLKASIRRTADSFFYALLSDIEAQNRRVCGSNSNSLVSDASYTTTGIVPGQTHTVTIRDDFGGQLEITEEEETEPTRVSTYFSANQSLVSVFMDSIALSPDPIGGGTLTESRAGEIASGVNNGTIPPDNIGVEAAKGPLGKNAEEIEKLTRQYLAQGNYQGLKVFATQLLGSILTGQVGKQAVAGAGIVGSKLAFSISQGRISAVFTSTRRMIMAGGQAGAVNFSMVGKILVNDGFVESSISRYPFKFSRYYFDKLMSANRRYPFIRAKEVLDSGKFIGPDDMPGFYRYETEFYEMIYNPSTREVWHLAPIKKR